MCYKYNQCRGVVFFNRNFLHVSYVPQATADDGACIQNLGVSPLKKPRTPYSCMIIPTVLDIFLYLMSSADICIISTFKFEFVCYEALLCLYFSFDYIEGCSEEGSESSCQAPAERVREHVVFVFVGEQELEGLIG